MDERLCSTCFESFVDNIPKSYEDIYLRENKEEWLKAVEEEVNAIKENDTWTLCDLPTGKKAIDAKWVFKVKRDDFDIINTFKARLVIEAAFKNKVSIMMKHMLQSLA